MTIKERRRKNEIAVEFLTAADPGPGPDKPENYFLPEGGYQIVEGPESMDIDYLF